jgi:hypothetical protein
MELSEDERDLAYGQHGRYNGSFDMDLHLIVRLIVVLMVLSMFLPKTWPALALKPKILTH